MGYVVPEWKTEQKKEESTPPVEEKTVEPISEVIVPPTAPTVAQIDPLAIVPEYQTAPGTTYVEPAPVPVKETSPIVTQDPSPVFVAPPVDPRQPGPEYQTAPDTTYRPPSDPYAVLDPYVGKPYYQELKAYYGALDAMTPEQAQWAIQTFVTQQEYPIAPQMDPLRVIPEYETVPEFIKPEQVIPAPIQEVTPVSEVVVQVDPTAIIPEWKTAPAEEVKPVKDPEIEELLSTVSTEERTEFQAQQDLAEAAYIKEYETLKQEQIETFGIDLDKWMTGETESFQTQLETERLRAKAEYDAMNVGELFATDWTPFMAGETKKFQDWMKTEEDRLRQGFTESLSKQDTSFESSLGEWVYHSGNIFEYELQQWRKGETTRLQTERVRQENIEATRLEEERKRQEQLIKDYESHDWSIGVMDLEPKPVSMYDDVEQTVLDMGTAQREQFNLQLKEQEIVTKKLYEDLGQSAVFSAVWAKHEGAETLRFEKELQIWEKEEKARLEAEFGAPGLAETLLGHKGPTLLDYGVFGFIPRATRAGAVASVESLIYGLGRLVGFDTPRIPPTVSGGLISSLVTSVKKGEITASPELEALPSYGAAYAAGTILGDVGTSIIMGEALRFATKPLVKPMQKLFSPVKSLFRGSRVESFLIKHTRYTPRLSPAIVSPSGVHIPVGLDSLRADNFAWDMLMEGSQYGKKLGRTAFIDFTKVASTSSPVLGKTAPIFPLLTISGGKATLYVSGQRMPSISDLLKTAPTGGSSQATQMFKSGSSIVGGSASQVSQQLLSVTTRTVSMFTPQITKFAMQSVIKTGISFTPSLLGTGLFMGLKSMVTPSYSTSIQPTPVSIVLEAPVLESPILESPVLESPQLEPPTMISSVILELPKPEKITRETRYIAPFTLPDLGPHFGDFMQQDPLQPEIPHMAPLIMPPVDDTILKKPVFDIKTGQQHTELIPALMPLIETGQILKDPLITRTALAPIQIPKLSTEQISPLKLVLGQTTHAPAYMPSPTRGRTKFPRPPRRMMNIFGLGRRRRGKGIGFNRQEYLYPVRGLKSMAEIVFGRPKRRSVKTRERGISVPSIWGGINMRRGTPKKTRVKKKKTARTKQKSRKRKTRRKGRRRSFEDYFW